MVRLYRPDQAADMLQVSRRTIQRMISDKQIATVLIRGAKRIPEIELERLIAEQMASCLSVAGSVTQTRKH